MNKWLDKYQDGRQVVPISDNTSYRKPIVPISKQEMFNNLVGVPNFYQFNSDPNADAPGRRALSEEYATKYKTKKALKKALKVADVTTDLMQLGNFIPLPQAQAIGKLGNALGTGIDAFQGGMDVAEGNYGSAGINFASTFLPKVIENYGYKRNMFNTTPGSYADKIANLGSRSGKYIHLTPYIQHINDPAVMKGVNYNRVLLELLGAETAIDSRKNGGLVSKNSLNRKVTCSNCGWSWKLSDGGLDPMTCHKCGSDIKMREGGELDKYEIKGEVQKQVIPNNPYFVTATDSNTGSFQGDINTTTPINTNNIKIINPQKSNNIFETISQNYVEPITHFALRKTTGYRYMPGNLSQKDTTIDLTNAPMTYAKVNQNVKGNTIIGGEYIENSNNSVRKAKDWINLKSGDTYSDKKYPSNQVQSFYGVENGRFKVGKATDFNPNTEIVPRRFGQTNINKAILNENLGMRLLDKNNNPIYQNSDDSGKFILYSPSTKKSQFSYISNGAKGVDIVNNFIKNNKDAQFIQLDNGRYDAYTTNPSGLTEKDFNQYYEQDWKREGTPGYNLIIQKNGGQLNKYQNRGEVRYNEPSSDNLQYQKPIVSNFIVDPLSGGYVHDPARAAALLNQPTNSGTISKTKDRSVGKQIYNVATNPMTSAQQLINKQPVTGLGPKNPFDFAFDAFPAMMAARQLPQIPGNLQRGEYLQAGLNALTAIPFLPKIPRGLPKVLSEGQPYEGAPHIYEDMVPVNGRYQPRTVITDAGVKDKILGLEATPIIPLNQMEYPVTSNKFLYGPHNSFGRMDRGLSGNIGDASWEKFKEKLEMHKWIQEQLRFDELPKTKNKESIGVLEDFKTRMQTPEGQKRLKELGITNDKFLKKLDIVEDPNTFGYYTGSDNKIVMNPNNPLPRKVVRHEIEHGVQTALQNSNLNKVIKASPYEKLKAFESGKTEIDDILSGLELRNEGTPDKVWDKSTIEDGKPIDITKYKSEILNKQNATDYFLTGSEGKEKSAFLAEVQQHMMDKGIIPKTSYTEITPEMVKKTFSDAMFDEEGGGKYLRLFNIMKPTENNYKLISKGLNKMLSLTPYAIPTAIGVGALNKKQQGGAIITNSGELNKYQDRGEVLSPAQQVALANSLAKNPKIITTPAPTVPTIRQGYAPTPYSEALRNQRNNEYARHKAMQNSDLAKTFASFTPGGDNVDAGVIGAETFANLNPVLSGPILATSRLAPAIMHPTNNAYWGADRSLGENVLGALGALGDVTMLTPYAPMAGRLSKVALREGVDLIHPVGRALKQIEKEGIANGLSPQEIKNLQMQEVGITSAQREGYFPGISEIVSEYITPYSYDNPKKRILDIPRRIIKGEKNSKSLADLDHNFIFDFETKNLVSKPRYDAWRMYSGLPQEYGTFRLAETSPINHPNYSAEQLGKLEKFSLNGERRLLGNLPNPMDNAHLWYQGKDDLIEAIPLLKEELNKIKDLKNKSIDYSNDFNNTNVMGGYNRRFFNDKMEYNDIWDLDLNGNKVEKYFGKPFLSHGQLDYSFQPAEDEIIRLIKLGESYSKNINIKKPPRLNFSFKDNGNYNTLLTSALQKREKLKQGGPIITNRGQWDYPGQTTIIPSNQITMQGVNGPLYLQPNKGKGRLAYPNEEHYFPKASFVVEHPIKWQIIED
jgi:hypothetical protein